MVPLEFHLDVNYDYDYVPKNVENPSLVVHQIIMDNVRTCRHTPVTQ